MQKIIWTQQLNSALLQLLSVSLVVMWGQGTEATASPQPLKDATFKTLPVSDVMFTEDVLWEKPARSRMECSVMCRGDAQCLMFTFRPATDGPAGSCRSYRKQHTAQGMKESAPGARSFRLVREVWIQKPCNIHSDCRELEPMAACFSGQCLCDGGLFFDHTDNACVKTCTRGFADTYLQYRHWELQGNQIGVYGSAHLDLKFCQFKCSGMSGCLSFVTWGSYCYFKYATSLHTPLAWRKTPAFNYYQKTCV